MENSTNTKQQICQELQSVKASLKESKEYYENYVNKLKKSFETDRQESENKLHLKEETINYYENQMHQLKEMIEKTEEENRQL